MLLDISKDDVKDILELVEDEYELVEDEKKCENLSQCSIYLISLSASEFLDWIISRSCRINFERNSGLVNNAC